MTFRKPILSTIALATIALLAGCNNGSNAPITVTLNTVPSSLAFNSQTAVVASVDNDKANGGVTWTCTATPSGPGCGSFSPATTNSGASSTYTAPYTLLPTGTTITITATSATNPAISASSAPITIAAPTLANGNYVFSVEGQDTNELYYLAGAFTVLNGKITAGEQDFVDFGVRPDYDLINPTGSSFTTTGDGNLQITLVACVPASATACGANDTNVGVGGVETFNGSVAALNANKFLITEFDASASSSGELIRQNATAAAAQTSGGYAFNVHGVDGGGSFVTVGGVINVDTPPVTGSTTSTISGTGSAFDADNEGDVYTYPAAGTLLKNASTVTAPDSFGRVVFSLSPTDSADFSTIALAGYVVDSTRVRLVETADGYGGTTGGTAFVQGANTGKFTATSVAGNTYVVALLGVDECNWEQGAAQVTLNADNSISGFMNYNDLTCLAEDPTAPSPLTGGTWTEDVGTGRVTLTGVTDGNVNTFNSEPVTFNLQFYLDGNGNLTALSMDPIDVLGGRGFEQSGSASIAGSSFVNAYALGVTGYDDNNEEEFDAAGGVVADGSANITGSVDVNWYLSSAGVAGSTTDLPTYTAAPVTGTFTAAAGAPFTGTVTGVDLLTCPIFNPTVDGAACNQDTFAYYLIDATGENIAIETDSNQLSLGYFDQQ
jgi:hypothetical protein